jgi:hypothetical protein
VFHDGGDAQNLINFGSDQEITGLDRLDDSTQDSKELLRTNHNESDMSKVGLLGSTPHHKLNSRQEIGLRNLTLIPYFRLVSQYYSTALQSALEQHLHSGAVPYIK